MIPIGTPYWFEALKPEVERIWGAHPDYGDDAQLMDIAAHTMISAFLHARMEDNECRRNLLYYYLSGPFSTDNQDDVLVMHRRTLPVDTFLPKAIGNLMIAYNEAPTRTWKVNGKENPEVSARLREQYDAAGADGRLQQNAREAKAHGGTLVRWYVGHSGRMQVEILTPDLCRYETHPQFPDVLTKVVKPLLVTKIDPATGEPTRETDTIYEVWTDEALYYTNRKGEAIKYQDDAGNVIEPEGLPNHYGRIPYVVCRLVEPNDNSVFGGGLFPLVEGNLAANKITFMSMLSAAYESFGHWHGVNLNLLGGENTSGVVKFGFGRYTETTFKQGSMDAAPPSLDYITGSGQYDRLGAFADEYEKRLLRTLGLPDSVINSQGGTPPSGIARMLERKELEEMRESDVLMLGPFEQAFSDLFCIVYNADVASVRDDSGKISPVPGIPYLPVPGTPTAAILDVAFHTEPIVEEPEKLLALNDTLLEKGLISLTRYLKEATGETFTSDEEAVRVILERRAIAEQLKGPTPDAPTETTRTNGAAPNAAPTPIEVDTMPMESITNGIAV